MKSLVKQVKHQGEITVKLQDDVLYVIVHMDQHYRSSYPPPSCRITLHVPFMLNLILPAC